jgi:hypothetical protein
MQAQGKGPVAVLADLDQSRGVLACQLKAIDAAAEQGYKSVVIAGDKHSKKTIGSVLNALKRKIDDAGGLQAFIDKIPKDSEAEMLSRIAALYALEKGLKVTIAVMPTKDEIQALKEKPPVQKKVERETLARSAISFVRAIKAEQKMGGVLVFPDERIYRQLDAKLNPPGEPRQSTGVRLLHETRSHKPLADAAAAVADGLGTVVRLTPEMTNTRHVYG